jgi:hypothetical protein
MFLEFKMKFFSLIFGVSLIINVGLVYLVYFFVDFNSSLLIKYNNLVDKYEFLILRLEPNYSFKNSIFKYQESSQMDFLVDFCVVVVLTILIFIFLFFIIFHYKEIFHFLKKLTTIIKKGLIFMYDNSDFCCTLVLNILFFGFVITHPI